MQEKLTCTKKYPFEFVGTRISCRIIQITPKERIDHSTNLEAVNQYKNMAQLLNSIFRLLRFPERILMAKKTKIILGTKYT